MTTMRFVQVVYGTYDVPYLGDAKRYVFRVTGDNVNIEVGDILDDDDQPVTVVGFGRGRYQGPVRTLTDVITRMREVS